MGFLMLWKAMSACESGRLRWKIKILRDWLLIFNLRWSTDHKLAECQSLYSRCIPVWNCTSLVCKVSVDWLFVAIMFMSSELAIWSHTFIYFWRFCCGKRWLTCQDSNIWAMSPTKVGQHDPYSIAENSVVNAWSCALPIWRMFPNSHCS